MTITTTTKPRWGEIADEDPEQENYYEDDEYLLSLQRQVIGPDEKGVKKIIEYKINEDGKKVKVVTTTKIRTKPVSLHAAERRGWSKFGDAVDAALNLSLVTLSGDHVSIKKPGTEGPKKDGPKEDPIKPKFIVCRTCKSQDHWTATCPYKGLLAPSEDFDKTSVDPVDPSDKRYVPPSRRDGGSGPSFRRGNEENSVRVSNLSEEATDDDLRELFGPFGRVTRVYIATDHKTGVSRGFGFVTFAMREDGERAIKKLNGYGYDNLILKVEWAAPRTKA